MALTCLIISGGKVYAGVIVFDTVTLQNRPVYLKVLTKGRFFPAGGERVRIEKEGVVLARILTGGDGYGFFKTEFESSGAHQINARSNGKSGTGTVLVVTPETPLLLMEIEVLSFRGLPSEKDAEGAPDALEQLSKSYGLIYLVGSLGMNSARNHIRSKRFPSSIVISYHGRKTFKRLKDKGLRLSVAIGSPKFLDTAADTVERRFSFERTSDGETVKNWKELTSRLQQTNPGVVRNGL